MKQIILVDTSVFLNILNVPGFNQDRLNVMIDLDKYIKCTATNLLLPIASIIETGNHISKLPDGGNRRKFAGILCTQVIDAIDGSAPWQAMRPPTSDDIRTWMTDFPDCAMRKLSMGDISIKCDWQKTCEMHPDDRVFIWTLDSDLAQYDTEL
jgi:hypothetical protein